MGLLVVLFVSDRVHVVVVEVRRASELLFIPLLGPLGTESI